MKILHSLPWFALFLSAAVPAQPPAPPSAPVELREVDLAYAAEGVVEAVRQATVAAQVQGRVVDMRVDAGSRVQLGQLLARIDEREATQAVAGAQAQLAQARAALANAQASFERTRNLHAQKFVSQAALDQSEAAWRAATAQLEAARAARDQAGTQRSFTSVAAPLSGIVAQRHTEAGEMAAPGKPLVTVFDPALMRVLAGIPQYKLAALRGGLRARVEFPETGRWLEAARVEVMPVVDARTHVAQARIYLPADAAGLVPGMYARAHFLIGKATKLVMPGRAVLRRGEVSAAYVVDERGGLRLRQLRLGEALPEGLVEVLAGVAAGERVALDPVKAGVDAAASAPSGR